MIVAAGAYIQITGIGFTEHLCVQVAFGMWRDWVFHRRRRWILFHLLAGVLGSAAIHPALFALHADFLRHWIGPLMGPIFPGYLLLIAALPVMGYQAWELAPVARPLAWLAATSVALFLAPPFLLALMLLDWSDRFGLGRALGGEANLSILVFVIGAVWAAPIQWLAIKSRIRFGGWWRAAGPSLGFAAIAAIFGFETAPKPWEDQGFTWNLGIPLACLIYAVGTLPVISSLLRPRDGPWTPTAATL